MRQSVVPNTIIIGPPDAGKTLLARAMPAILPRLTIDEALDVTRIYSVADQLPPDVPLVRNRPFRAPHHTISHAGLVGGGNWPHPGEISLAHRGVLFLDELPEFGPRVLEVLRQPVEDKVVTISRAQGSLTFPANFQLVAAMNPCPCGYFGDALKPCTCSPSTVTKYQKRISGPLLDRIDIHIEVPRVEYDKLSDSRLGEPSEAVQSRVEAARGIQRARFVGARQEKESPTQNPSLAEHLVKVGVLSEQVFQDGRIIPEAHPVEVIGAGLAVLGDGMRALGGERRDGHGGLRCVDSGHYSVLSIQYSG